MKLRNRNWHNADIVPIFFIWIMGSCLREETPVDVRPIVHGWEVVNFTSPKASVPQNPTERYLIEFVNDGTFFIDFDRGGCGSTFNIPKTGVINLEPFSFDFCSHVTKYAKDLQDALLTSTGYSIKGDSDLILTGAGEIKLKRSLDCAQAGCQRNTAVIPMTIKRNDGSDVLLTAAKLVRLSDQHVIYLKSNDGIVASPPDYFLIDDNYRKIFLGRKVEVEFQGFVNDTMVVKRSFTVTADCCHVSLLSGNTNVVVD